MSIAQAHKKSLKKSYKHLTPAQKKIIKAIENKNIAEKELYGPRGFFAREPRNNNGAVDFENMSEIELSIFENIQKNFEQSCKILNKFDEKEIEKALKNL